MTLPEGSRWKLSKIWYREDRDGSTVSKRVHRIDNKGSRGRPLSFDQLEEKFLGCASGYGNVEAAKQAFRLMARIETLTDICEVTACLK